jgi:tetratricopeptide (TPR) repeat protein
MEEAIEEARKAIEIDPFSVLPAGWLAVVLVFARRPDDAIAAAAKAIALDPGFFLTYLALAGAHACKGQFDEAIAVVERASSIIALPVFLSYRGHLYGRTGHRDEALQMLRQLEDLSSKQYIAPYQIESIYIGMGDIEAWRETLRKTYAERETSLLFMKNSWIYDSVQTDPLFQEIITKLGLP